MIEDLAVSNMVGNHSLSRAINDAGRRQFRQQLEYKADWYGRDVIVIDRARGPVPAVTHDRDVNAARNILAAGLAVGDEAENPAARAVGLPLVHKGEEVNRVLCRLS